jgi:hypothetical protein
MATMGDDLRHRYAEAIQACGPLSVTKVLYAVMAVRDDELQWLRARVAELEAHPVDWDAQRRRADLADKDRDSWRERAEKAEAANARTRERLDALIADGFGAVTDTLRELRAALDDTKPETTNPRDDGQHG